MSFTIEEWKKAKEAWGNIKKQALTDIEQAELFMSAIDKKIEELEKNNEVKHGE